MRTASGQQNNVILFLLLPLSIGVVLPNGYQERLERGVCSCCPRTILNETPSVKAEYWSFENLQVFRELCCDVILRRRRRYWDLDVPVDATTVAARNRARVDSTVRLPMGTMRKRKGKWKGHGRKDECVALQAQYVYDTFGKFPGTVPAMFLIMYLRTHPLDLDFYDRFYKPGSHLKTHAMHMAHWHSADAA